MTCERCVELEAGKIVETAPGAFKRLCDRCREPIANYVAMGGAGFESHSIDHYHDERANTGGNRVFRLPVKQELCHACYLADFAAFYPGYPLPQIANVQA